VQWDVADDVALSLSPAEVKILEKLRTLGPGKSILGEELAGSPGLTLEVVRGSLERLRAKKLILVEEKHDSAVHLTERGEEALKNGLPERKLLSLLENGSLTQQDAKAKGGFDDQEYAVAVGRLKRSGCVTMGEKLERKDLLPKDPFPEESSLRSMSQGQELAKDATQELIRRGLAEREHRTTRLWSISPEGARLPLPTEGATAIGALTSAHLKGRTWEKATLRPYDPRAAVPYVSGARTHAYLSWLREFEDILVGLGFEEKRGPLAEPEFYNSDILFIPQNHPARTMQEVFFLEGVEGKLPPKALLEKVAAVHEGRPLPDEEPISAGWGSTYQTAIAKRTVLRSHTTPVSVRTLLTHPKPPFRIYSLGPAFRRDAVDAKHHIQFDQCEGVFGDRDVSLRHLLGLFTQLAKAIGIDEVRFKPTYFPFTEPSVEGYVKHPSMGWIEVMPGGLFRPEVLRPLGIKVPVAAWGMGIGRLAMVALGLDDIRDLFMDDLSRLANSRS
jgi:phenylalanyl-tRNA synthetase alpha chain